MKAKTKKKTPPPTAPVVPQYITESRVYQRKRVTKRKLPSFEEAMFLLHVPEMARLYFQAIYEGLKDRDKTTLEHAGEMLGFVQRKGININVAQQMMQQNAVAGPAAPVMGFDALARQLAEKRVGHALPAPAEVIEVHPVETASEVAHG